jgi:hypothetical protein
LGLREGDVVEVDGHVDLRFWIAVIGKW